MSWILPYVPIPDFKEQGFNTPENYQVKIYSNQLNEVIRANLPENFSLSVGSDWDQPFAKPITDYLKDAGALSGKFSSITDLASSLSGMTPQMKWLSMSVWTQGTGLELELPLVFRAFNDPVKDVTDKIVKLMRMVAPEANAGGQLQAPGPSIMGNVVGYNTYISGENITVELGNFVRLSPVIVRQVSSEVISQFDQWGNPMSATVNISIQTPYVITKGDIAELFTNNSLKKNKQTPWEQQATG